jgi:type II secretory pathway pseudopilin PulG
MPYNKNKKSQMEIMGISIVVVLLVLGLLFAVKFVLFKPQTSYRKDYTSTQLAANILNTMLKTNTYCQGYSVTELLQDASKDFHNIRTCPGNLSNSREYVNLTIYVLLEVTVKDLTKRDYYFKASTQDKIVVEVGTEYTNRERERKTQFIQTDAGIMTIILDIY